MEQLSAEECKAIQEGINLLEEEKFYLLKGFLDLKEDGNLDVDHVIVQSNDIKKVSELIKTLTTELDRHKVMGKKISLAAPKNYDAPWVNFGWTVRAYSVICQFIDWRAINTRFITLEHLSKIITKKKLKEVNNCGAKTMQEIILGFAQNNLTLKEE